MFRQPSRMLMVAAVAAASIRFGPSHPTNSRASSSSLFVVCDAAFLIPAADNHRIHNTRNMSMSGSRSSSSSRLSSSSMNNAQTPKQKTFNYFAYGSNMLSSTMIDLRQLQPISSTAAVLPGYRLRFNVPGLPGIEPSWASVEPVPYDDDERCCDEQPIELVHGVMHTLTAQDFATVCRTEGVPFSYLLQKCPLVPYIGDGKAAGQCKWESSVVASSTSTSSTMTRSTMNNNSNWGVSAYTLLAGPVASLRRREDDIPPSRSYMNVLLRGAKEFALDASYLRKLEQIQVGKTWIGDGLAEGMLQRAAMERRR